MIAAFINGSIGLLLSLALGHFYLELGLPEILLFVGVSNLAGLVSLLTTLQAERVQWIKKHLLNRSLKTWLLLSVIYLGILIGIAAPLRQPKNFAILFLPLLLSTGFSILVFGPIQDRLVRWRNKKKMIFGLRPKSVI